MKLNLLPTYVGKGRQLTVAIVFGVMLIAASAGITVVMISNANQQLDKVKTQAAQYDKPVQDAIDHADKAAQIIAPLQPVVRNINLANAMLQHNPVYPDFYSQIFPQIPDFFRINNIQANPIDANTVNLRMVGVLKTQEQYRDLLLTLLRMKGAQTVTRSAFTPKFSILPGVSETDQNPEVPDPDQPNLPKDPLQKLDALIASGQQKAFVPAPGYGGDPGERGPIPDYQLITVTVVLQGYDLQTPNPSATLGVASTAVAGGRPGGRPGGKGLVGG